MLRRAGARLTKPKLANAYGAWRRGWERGGEGARDLEDVDRGAAPPPARGDESWSSTRCADGTRGLRRRQAAELTLRHGGAARGGAAEAHRAHGAGRGACGMSASSRRGGEVAGLSRAAAAEARAAAGVGEADQAGAHLGSAVLAARLREGGDGAQEHAPRHAGRARCERARRPQASPSGVTGNRGARCAQQRRLGSQPRPIPNP